MNKVGLMKKNELQNMSNFYNGEKFNGIVIVPMDYEHESGYQCMKYILLDREEIVGVVGGSSDVMHINGIGGLGKEPDYKTRMVKAHDLRIDCLPESQCLRLFSDDYMDLPFNFCGSDFIFEFVDYKVGGSNEKEN